MPETMYATPEETAFLSPYALPGVNQETKKPQNPGEGGAGSGSGTPNPADQLLNGFGLKLAMEGLFPNCKSNMRSGRFQRNGHIALSPPTQS